MTAESMTNLSFPPPFPSLRPSLPLSPSLSFPLSLSLSLLPPPPLSLFLSLSLSLSLCQSVTLFICLSVCLGLFLFLASSTSPVGIHGLILSDGSKVKALGENVSLCPGVADVALRVQLFCNSHCLLCVDPKFSRCLFLQFLSVIQKEKVWKRTYVHIHIHMYVHVYTCAKAQKTSKEIKI